MARILILGAGLGGLATAMLLARDAHEVIVLERDPAGPPPPEDTDTAWNAWQRRGVNQFRLPHFMLPRWHAQMALELPDVLASRYNGLCDGIAIDTPSESRDDDEFTAMLSRIKAIPARTAERSSA